MSDYRKALEDVLVELNAAYPGPLAATKTKNLRDAVLSVLADSSTPEACQEWCCRLQRKAAAQPAPTPEAPPCGACEIDLADPLTGGEGHGHIHTCREPTPEAPRAPGICKHDFVATTCTVCRLLPETWTAPGVIDLRAAPPPSPSQPGPETPRCRDWVDGVRVLHPGQFVVTDAAEKALAVMAAQPGPETCGHDPMPGHVEPHARCEQPKGHEGNHTAYNGGAYWPNSDGARGG